MPNQPRIAIVEDDASFRDAMAGLMRSLGFPIRVFALPAELLAFPDLCDISCLIADVHMPGMTGIEMHKRLAALGHAIPTIFITGYPDDSVQARLLDEGAVCYLSKPFENATLLDCLRKALNRMASDEQAL